MDAGELSGFLVGGDGLQSSEIAFFDDLELRTQTNALIAMREVGGIKVRSEQFGGFLALGVVLSGRIVGEPDVAEFVERVAADPIGDEEAAVVREGQADAHDAAVDDAFVCHDERSAARSELEGGHFAAGELIEDEMAAE